MFKTRAAAVHAVNMVPIGGTSTRSAVAKITIGRQRLGGDRARPPPEPEGDKAVTIPLAPRAARASDLTIKERGEGADLPGCGWRRLDRHGAARIVRRAARPDLLAAV
jgi:hypothetical protein